MSAPGVPEGYNSVSPYLVVPGVAQLLEFVKEVFGAVERFRMPNADGQIMHAEVTIGDTVVMMGEGPHEGEVHPGYLHVYVPDADATYARALKAGATSIREPADQFYGDRNAGVRDASGNTWWIATRVREVSPEELAGHSGA